jgi:plasmid stabilization system protein ParE
MTEYRFTSAALAELREATLYYERNEPGVGLKFLDEINDTVGPNSKISARMASGLSTISAVSTHRFPFGLLFQVRADGILITAVMDLRRGPRRWRELI